MKTEKFKTMDILLILWCLYSITTLTQDWYPFSMNRLVIAGAIAILVFASVKHSGKLVCFFYGYLVLFGLYTVCIAENKAVNVVDYIYYFTAFLQMFYFSREEKWEELRDSAERLDRFLGIVVAVDFGIILFSLLWPGCHQTHEFWGEKTYFFGFTSSVHVISAGCCLAMSLMVLYLAKRKFSVVHLLLLGVYAYAVLESGARVFLVPVLILAFVYVHNRITNKRLLQMIYGIGIPVLVILFAFSGFFQKIVYQLAYSEKTGISFLTTFTNGRDTLWAKDLADFMHNRPLFQLLGNGFDYVYVLNYSPITNAGIGAHSDFINILVSAGILGLSWYLVLLVRILRTVCRKRGFINSVMIVTYVVFPAFINGFYNYYHYFVSFFLFALAIQIMSEKKEQKASLRKDA